MKGEAMEHAMGIPFAAAWSLTNGEYNGHWIIFLIQTAVLCST
jgi:hypothetical protein